jgi:hypothetical protein
MIFEESFLLGICPISEQFTIVRLLKPNICEKLEST